MAEEKYDQAFFLDLAAKGKDAWNAWRRDPVSKHVPVTFAGIDFSKAPNEKINFEGFEFGNRADFSNCKWQIGASASGLEKFLKIASDVKAFAPGRACFTGAAFDLLAKFTGATFGEFADFTGATLAYTGR
jgi:hypothetical protein